MASDDGNTKATLCKTISCLLPNDLEVKRACQLTEFLLEPTVEAYYAVETLYNEPDQKLEEESMPVPNSLRCELLLVFKTQWPFDPEFWDWRTLKRNCLALMGEEASIVSSIDLLNDNEEPEEEEEEDALNQDWLKNVPEHIVNGTYELTDVKDKREKNREMKKLREKGFISARFRNWQAYMQYCVLCDKEFLGHRIVRHAQTHMSSGVYTCPICAQTFSSKDTLVPHVTSHVKQSCKERLTAMKTSKKLAAPKTAVPVAAALEAKTENQLKEKSNTQGQNRAFVSAAVTQGARPTLGCSEDHVCPVGKCRKSFKFFKNLVAHVKGHGDDEEAKTFLEMHSKKVVCQYCRRYFISVTHLNDHLQVHCGAKPYICIQLNCKESFLHNTELLVHRKTHPVFRARCMFPNCGKIFSEAFKLYDHEAQHYKTFTCNYVDCGKVFHSQKQLDLHQEKHAALEEESQASEPKPPNVPHARSLIEQMLSSNPKVQPESSQETWNHTTSALTSDQKKQQMSLESLLKQSKVPVVCLEQCRVSQDSQRIPSSSTQTQSVNNNSVIQPVNSHVPDTDRPKDGFRDQSVDYTSQIKPHEYNSDIPQGQPQIFPTNAPFVSTNYNTDCSAPLSGQQGPACSGSSSVGLPLQNSTGPAVSQLLPPTVTPQPFTASRPENTLIPPTSTAPPVGERERFHCPFENCTRHYSCYRSVTKHMRVVHPDFYVHWKVARTKIKITYALPDKPASVGQLGSDAVHLNQQGNRVPVHGVQRQNVIQPAPYANMDTNMKYAPMHPHSSPAQNHNPSLMMENVLNPIVLSQLGSVTNPASQKWNPAPENDQTQNCGTLQAFPSDLQAMSQVDSTSSATLPLGGPSCSMMGAANRPAESLQSLLLENGSQSVMTPYMDGAKNVLQQSYTPQMQSSLVSASSAPEVIKTVQKQLQPNSPSPDSASLANKNIPLNAQSILENDPEYLKRAKRNKRTKWPAIVRDGKFICCRCFRQFNSPKSLGGHLSKRVICKPYDESELSTELPASFLDLLNSESTPAAAQPQLSYNPNSVCQEKPHQSVTDGPTAIPQYSQADILGYGNSEPNYNTMKQINTEPNMSDVFMHSPAPESLFQNPCVPYGGGERLPASSVIQHTENVHVRQKDTAYSAAHYPPPCVDAFAGHEYPDFSRILTENTSPSVPAATNHSEAFPSEGYSSQNTIQTPVTNSNPVTQAQVSDSPPRPPVSIKQPDAQRKMAEQDVKKRLREQILAGDFQRRTNLCHSSNTDSNANFRNPISSGPVFSPTNNSEHHQESCDAKTDSVIRVNFASLPESSSDIENLLNTQSFTCFRDTSTPQLEVLSPAGIMSNDTDIEPTQLTASQQQWMTEIQSAFERLDLVREISNQMSASMKLSGSAVAGQTGSAPLALSSPSSSKAARPFTCENESCAFSSMSSEAFWRHLSKTHNYTLEMVNVVKKKYGQYAPFKCLKCSKTFTRNSNLRTHYQTAHKLPQEEIEELDLKRRQAKAAASAAVYNQASAAQAPAPTQPSEQTKTWSQPVSGAPKHNVQAYVPCTNVGLANNKYQTHVSPLTPIQPLQTALPQANGPLGKQLSINSQSIVKPNIEVSKKPTEKKPNSGSATSPYRPYRCVHQGCFAAFTIQHNLILHYRAVHQSALSALEVNEDQEHCDDLDEEKGLEEEGAEAEVPQISEFRCQVKDCSRVFQEIPNLLQHYVQLHKFGLDRVGIFLSGIKSGKFTCGYQGCLASFPTCWKYLGHVKEEHKDMLGKPEQLNGSFRCEIEGCDRSYTTKSNMLRHFMKKHQDLYKARLKNQRVEEHRNPKTLLYPISKTSNGKENIESNKKILQKGGESKKESKVKNNHWTKYGKPSLKSKVEAAAMCTKKFPLQYPCMIKGCESVMKSERNILKHYIGHGLSEKYLEQQRSYFIFCKKVPRQKCRSSRSDDSKSDNTSDLSDNDITMDGGFEEAGDGTKPVLRKRATAEVPVALLESKMSNDDSSDSSVVVKRKRGRPRKLIETVVKRKKIPRTTKADVVYSWDNESDSSCHAVIPEDVSEKSAPLASLNFKPMGFEMSFLKFLEQSTKCERPLSRMVDAAEPCGRTSSANTKDTCVRFRNRQSIKSLSKVKVVIDGAFSGVADLMLKQLQDMQPTVVLGKRK